jgi:hypothetical protein
MEMTMHFAHMIAHFFVGYGTHTTLLPGAPPVPGITPHLSAFTLLGLTINAKYSPTVLGMGGIPLCGRGNDSGFFVPHLDLGGTSALLPIVIPLGSSKIMFGSSKTKALMNDNSTKDVGCCLIPYYPAWLNQACNDPLNYPSDAVCSPNTVMVGMTVGDVVGGFADIAFDAALSYLLSSAGGGIASRLQGRFYREGSARLMLWMANNPRLTQFIEQGVDKLLSAAFGTVASSSQEGIGQSLGADIIHDGWSAIGQGAADLIAGDDGPARNPMVHQTSDSLSTDPNIRFY